ncbi:MAG: CinA family protein [Bacteroidaceae bacterium]|nr:CinA family protein [Bacteroidaceae bacterium]
MSEELNTLSRMVNDALRKRGFTLSVAESCTGGSIASAITSIPGSSDIFKGGIVAYANEVKRDILSVSEENLQIYGAVSEQVVRQMVVGVASIMHTTCAIATSGVAGPGGGSPEKPVGTVWVAFLVDGKVDTCKLTIEDCGREANIEVTTLETLKKIHSLLCDS